MPMQDDRTAPPRRHTQVNATEMCAASSLDPEEAADQRQRYSLELTGKSVAVEMVEPLRFKSRPGDFDACD